MSSIFRHFLTTAPSLSTLISTTFRKRGMLLSRRLCCLRLQPRAPKGFRGQRNGYRNLDSSHLGGGIGGAFPRQSTSTQTREGISQASNPGGGRSRQRLSALVTSCRPLVE